MSPAAPTPWMIGSFPITCQDGPAYIPGWTDGVFGIDWRASPHGMGAYVVTHIGTGWSVFAILRNIEEVKEIVSTLEKRFDWWGSDIEAINSRIRHHRHDLATFFHENDCEDPRELIAPPGFHREDLGSRGATKQ
ncbi:MAG: hypothetical protein ACTHOJ_14590 [Sphingomonas oligoaromativorans]